jgi:hypothetical protein
MQIDHVSIPVADLAAARASTKALAPLGVQLVAEFPSDIAAWRPTKDRATAVAPPQRPINHQVTGRHHRQPRTWTRQGVHRARSTGRYLTHPTSTDKQSPDRAIQRGVRGADERIRRGAERTSGSQPRSGNDVDDERSCSRIAMHVSRGAAAANRVPDGGHGLARR